MNKKKLFTCSASRLIVATSVKAIDFCDLCDKKPKHGCKPIYVSDVNVICQNYDSTADTNNNNQNMENLHAPRWTDDEIEILCSADSCEEAVEMYFDAFGEERSQNAISKKYHRLNRPSLI
jgi:hypothetical protein